MLFEASGFLELDHFMDVRLGVWELGFRVQDAKP